MVEREAQHTGSSTAADLSASANDSDSCPSTPQLVKQGSVLELAAHLPKGAIADHSQRAAEDFLTRELDTALNWIKICEYCFGKKDGPRPLFFEDLPSALKPHSGLGSAPARAVVKEFKGSGLLMVVETGDIPRLFPSKLSFQMLQSGKLGQVGYFPINFAQLNLDFDYDSFCRKALASTFENSRAGDSTKKPPIDLVPPPSMQGAHIPQVRFTPSATDLEKYGAPALDLSDSELKILENLRAKKQLLSVLKNLFGECFVELDKPCGAFVSSLISERTGYEEAETQDIPDSQDEENEVESPQSSAKSGKTSRRKQTMQPLDQMLLKLAELDLVIEFVADGRRYVLPTDRCFQLAKSERALRSDLGLLVAGKLTKAHYSLALTIHLCNSEYKLADRFEPYPVSLAKVSIETQKAVKQGLS